MKRKISILSKGLLPFLALPSLSMQAQEHKQAQAEKDKSYPNVIFIMVDDLGIGDLGCYGQKQIKTPSIDKLAKNGIRFAQHYSGSTVSAPSRCALLTGKHKGNAFIRGNKGTIGPDGENYNYPLSSDEKTVADFFKQKNYTTACIGKWGLGGPESEGHPLKHGFDYFSVIWVKLMHIVIIHVFCGKMRQR